MKTIILITALVLGILAASQCGAHCGHPLCQNPGPNEMRYGYGWGGGFDRPFTFNAGVWPRGYSFGNANNSLIERWGQPFQFRGGTFYPVQRPRPLAQALFGSIWVYVPNRQLVAPTPYGRTYSQPYLQTYGQTYASPSLSPVCYGGSCYYR